MNASEAKIRTDKGVSINVDFDVQWKHILLSIENSTIVGVKYCYIVSLNPECRKKLEGMGYIVKRTSDKIFSINW